MPIVRFSWDAQRVSLRRAVCPHARSDKGTHAWTMTAADVAAFLLAARARLYSARVIGSVIVDDTAWVLVFTQGTPLRLEAGSASTERPASAAPPETPLA